MVTKIADYKWKFMYLEDGHIYYTGWVKPETALKYWKEKNIVIGTRSKHKYKLSTIVNKRI